MYHKNTKNLAAKIRLERIQKRFTLRELAEMTSLSHGYINRIEQGLLTPSKETLKTIQEALGFNYNEASADCIEFKTYYNLLYRSVIYADYGKAKEYLRILIDKQDVYTNCECFIDYYIIVFMAFQQLKIERHRLEGLHEKIQILLPTMRKSQKEIALLQSAIYSYYQEKNISLALEKLTLHQSLSENSNLLAISYFLNGFIYSQDYRKYKQSLQFYLKAKQLFQNQNNFNRVIFVRLFQQILYINMHRYQEFLESNQQTTRFAEIKGLETVYKVSLSNLARYHIARGDYDDALKLYNGFVDETSNEYYFLKAYTLYNLGYHVEALATLKACRKKQRSDYRGLYLLGVQCLETLIKNVSSKENVRMLNQFFELAFELKQYLFIRIAYKLIKVYIPVTRQYKEIYHYSVRVLEAIQHICGKEDVHEVIS